MSVLSDDTDVLLLIPPDFFLIPSDSDEEPPKQGVSESMVVSDLITQVNDLEGRICLIENRCLNETAMTGNLHQLRHYGSAETLNHSSRSCFNSRSLQGTPCKSGLSPWKQDHSPLRMRENMLRSSEYAMQRDRDEQLLKEVEQFFKQRRNNEEEGGDNGATLTRPEGAQLSTAFFNLNKVNDLLKKLDETQKEIEDKVKLKELNEIETEDSLNLDGALEKGLGSDGDKFGSDRARLEQTKNAKRVLSFEEEGRKEDGTGVGSESQCAEDSPGAAGPPVGSGKSRSSDGGERKAQATTQPQELTNLLSLSNLWGSSVNINGTHSETGDEKILKQKLQEERCRRQHCESLIQQLQLSLLEEQQKVAVAMKVDREKDQAIGRLTESWNKLVDHWRDLETQRNKLTKKLLSDREKFKSEMSTACQTVKRYEAELSKALDLAHGYKEKCEASDREKKTFRASVTREIENLKSELRETAEKLRAEECKGEKLEKLLGTKEELVNQGKAKLSELQNQIRDGRRSLKEVQTELESAKSERDKLNEKLKEERGKVSAAEQGKKAAQQQNEELKKKEKGLREEVKSLTEQMEKVKAELKEFYQEQVESIVQEKLKEFQEQLAAAEKALQAEIEVREKTVTEMAVKQVQQIVEKHLTEINLLEEKHKENAELWRLQMSQKDEKIKELQKRLEQYSSSKTVIAQRLHSVMEAQWQEALKIINSSSPQQVKSPPTSGRSEPAGRQQSFGVAGWGDGNGGKSTTSSESPFCQEGVLTFREDSKTGESLTYRVDETPQKMPSDHLKEYIRTLLERAPGRPTADPSGSVGYKSADPLTDESSLTPWQQILSEPSSQLLSDASKFSEGSRAPREAKPPWK